MPPCVLDAGSPLLGLLAFRDLLAGEAGLALTGRIRRGCPGPESLVFLSSGTLMSDVPALAFSLIALVLYARAVSGRGQLRSNVKKA